MARCRLSLASLVVVCGGTPTLPACFYNPTDASLETDGSTVTQTLDASANATDLRTSTPSGGPDEAYELDCRREPADIDDGFVGVAYSYQPTLTGGVPPYIWSADGLPDGLIIDPATGRISGTPTTPGHYPVTLTVLDAEAIARSRECGELAVRAPIVVDPGRLLELYPAGCVSYGATLDELIAQGVVADGDGSPITCMLERGRGNGDRDFDGDPNTESSFPSGIAVDPDTCELSGAVDSQLRYGIYTWITTLQQSGQSTHLPYCAPQEQQAGTAYTVLREDGAAEATLKPGIAHMNHDGFTFGTEAPDPKVTVTYNQSCGPVCFYTYVFYWNALTGGSTGTVLTSPSVKFPAMGFEGFTHAIRIAESEASNIERFRERAWVVNLSFDYCIAQNDTDCGSQELDPNKRADLIRQNGGGSNYEFGLIVLPAD